jgi:hypothetical protein
MLHGGRNARFPSSARHPAQTTRRALEDFTAHALVDRHRGEKEKDPHRWTLTEFSRARLDAFPEMSSNARSGIDRGLSHQPTFRENTQLDLDEVAA